MRDELNRNTYADLVYKQNESMNPLEPMTDIPEDESKHVGTNTSQSLSREDADHSGFSQDVAGPADADKEEWLNPDPSALEAWKATGAEPDNRTLGEETASHPHEERISIDYEENNSDEAVITGKLPLDHVPADTSFSLGSEANATYPRRTPVYNTAFEGDTGIRHDEVFADKSAQSMDVEQTETTLEDVPDADELHVGSPVDPAVPDGIDQHGIDLLNGVGGVDDENERKLPDDF